MENTVKNLIDKLEKERMLNTGEFTFLLENFDGDTLHYTAQKADAVRRNCYSDKIFIRGLIEFTNICRNDCFYCGIRKSNTLCNRYRLSENEIYSCCNKGYNLGFRTFVLQGGEDSYFTDEILCRIIKTIKLNHPDCAVTLSLGERSFDSYKALKNAGADRYLLRHETANSVHYSLLHPNKMTLESRKECLYNLKALGYQVGAGFMVGSPYQSFNNIAEDLEFLHFLKPEMVGIGPFIPHCDTPFSNFEHGNTDLTLLLLSIIRLMLPNVLLPATTALNTLCENGSELGIKAGANVLMPNLSPIEAKEKYSLYDNKSYKGGENAYQIENLKNKFSKIGYEIITDRGDYKK